MAVDCVRWPQPATLLEGSVQLADANVETYAGRRQ